MSNKSSNELVVNPAPHITTPMSKNRLMQFTFFALLIILAVTIGLWSQVNTSTGGNLGLTVGICALIAVGISVLVDLLIGKVTSDSEVNTWSAAVFGLIVVSCYSFGLPPMHALADAPVEAPLVFFYVAIISLIGIVVFKKVMSVAGRKFVNPAAAAKFLALLPAISSTFLASDHLPTGGLAVPSLAGPIDATTFGIYIQTSYSNPMITTGVFPNIEWLMIIEKFHGWAGGASSIAVIVVGILFFVLARKYLKWKITLSYLVSIAVLSLMFSFIFADGDLTTRLLFEVFMGSSIFMAFFMATDPATTPYGGIGQIIFGVGLAILTILIQTFMGFFGGALLALLIMNLTVPLIDRIRINKPFGR